METLLCPGCLDVNERPEVKFIGKTHKNRVDELCRECYVKYTVNVQLDSPGYVLDYLPSDGLLAVFEDDADVPVLGQYADWWQVRKKIVIENEMSLGLSRKYSL